MRTQAQTYPHPGVDGCDNDRIYFFLKCPDTFIYARKKGGKKSPDYGMKKGDSIHGLI